MFKQIKQGLKDYISSTKDYLVYINDESKKSVSDQIHHIGLGLGTAGQDVSKVIDEVNKIKQTIDHSKNHKHNKDKHDHDKKEKEKPKSFFAKILDMSKE